MSSHTTATANVPLTSRSLLIDFSVGKWHARKKDEKTTQDVARRAGVGKNAGNYRKNLLHQVDAPAYDVVTGIENEARTYHRLNTLAWSDGGGELRILPSAKLLEYLEKMRGFRSRFEAAVPEFVSEALKSGGYFEKAIENLRGMGDRADYPWDPAALARQFKMEVKRWPVPDVARDFRLEGVTEQQLAEMRAEVEADVREREATLMKEVWQRAYDAIAHAVDILGENGGRRTVAKGKKKSVQSAPARVTEAFFTNLQTVCAILPSLNLSHDPRLNELVTEMEQKIAGCDPSFIRKSKLTRKQVADDADAIMKKMAAYMPQ